MENRARTGCSVSAEGNTQDKPNSNKKTDPLTGEFKNDSQDDSLGEESLIDSTSDGTLANRSNRLPMNRLASTTPDPTSPPILEKAELKFKDENGQPFENNQSVLFLTGSNILVNNSGDPLGSRFEDLIAKFNVGYETYEGTILTDLCRDLGSNQCEVAVKVPNTAPLGASRIILSRRQNDRVGENASEPMYEEVQYNSNPIRVKSEDEYVFAALPNADRVAVLDGADPKSVAASTSSSDIVLSRISVGTDDKSDRPRELAFTSDGTRAYVVLEASRRVALVDGIVLQQVDVNPNTPEINPIDLPTGALPQSIAIHPENDCAYIADSGQGNIYVLDINPFSQTYHQVIQTISVQPASSGLRQMTISSDGHKLLPSILGTRPTILMLDFRSVLQMLPGRGLVRYGSTQC